jgi:hypothetical protein
MGEKSLVWQNLELQDEIKALKFQLETRKEAYGLVCHKCDMWRAAAEIADTRCKGLQLAVDQYRDALKRIYALTHPFDDQNVFAKTIADIAAAALEEK